VIQAFSDLTLDSRLKHVVRVTVQIIVTSVVAADVIQCNTWQTHKLIALLYAQENCD